MATRALIEVLTLGAALSVVGACATTARLDAKFDSDPLSARPVSAPPPTPPNDQLTWTTQKPLTSTVVADPGGGRMVRIAPLPAFTASPELRQLALLASTEPLTTSPPAQVRGSLRVRLDGPGIVLITFQPVQGSANEDYVAGIEVGNFIGPSSSPGLRGTVSLLRGFAVAKLNDIFGLPSVGTMGNPAPGSFVNISWSIDQSGRTFSASIAGGTPQTTTFPLPSTAPVDQLRIELWMQKPTSATAAFVDDLFVEEYK